ncbi:MAG: AAA family ATPase [Promethearchaeota archaeon]
MIITKVQLKNITTHKNNTIEFEDGINVLMGPNGTGKSTVLTMIGYVLFDYLPGKNQKSYVRVAPSAKKFGTIKIWIRGKDEEEYCIERTIGKGNNKLEVTHSETGAILEKINRKDNFISWIQDQMGLGKNFSLSTIFENAIGVAQGTFTAPFLMSPSQRAQIFAPLLNVKIYKDIYSKSNNITNSFKEEITEIEKEISHLEGELKDKEQISDEKTELEENLTKLKDSSVKTANNLEQIMKKYEELMDRKKKLEKISIECDKLVDKEKSISDNIKNIKNEIKEASLAKEICDKTKKDYQKFIELSENEKIIQKQNRILQENLEKSNDLKQSLAKIEAELVQISKYIEEINQSSGILPDLEEKFNKYKLIQGKNQKIANKIGSLVAKQDNLKNIIIENGEIQDKIKGLKEKLKVLPEIEKNCTKIEPLDHDINEINQKIAVKKEEIKNLKQNKKDSKGGKCPFLHEKCKNIEGDSLEEYFQNLIDEEQRLLQELNLKLSDLTREMKKLKPYEKKLNSLEKSKIELEQLVKQQEENSLKIKTLKEETKELQKLEKESKKIQEEQELLEDDVKKYNIIKEKITKELPKFNQEKTKKTKKIKTLKKNLAPFEAKIIELEKIPIQLKEIQDEMELKRKNYEAYQENLKSMKKLSKYEEQLKEIESKLDDIKTDLKKKEKKKESLEKKFDIEEFLKVEKEKEELSEKSINIKAEIKNKGENLDNIIKKLEKLNEKEKELILKNQNWNELNKIKSFSDKIRIWFKEAQPKITEALMTRINHTASELFRKITGEEAIQLKWQKDYDIEIITAQNPSRIFSQLSGGEQMSAALAVRLAVLKVLTKIDFAFFDEPTTNLDLEKRKNLAKCIQNVRGFKQLFVISHDDTFEENADYSIHFSKNSFDETQVDFLEKEN